MLRWIVYIIAFALLAAFLVLCFRAYVRPKPKPVRRPERRPEVREWAKKHGYKYQPEHGTLASTDWGHPVKSTDGDWSARDVVLGERPDQSVTAFTVRRYHSAGRTGVGNGPSSYSTSFWSVVAIGVTAPLPGFEIALETKATRLAHGLGGHDIDVGDDQFDRTFHVRGDDAAAVRAILNQRVRALMLKHADDAELRVVGDHVVQVHTGKLDLSILAQQIDYLSAVAAALSTSSATTTPGDDTV